MDNSTRALEAIKAIFFDAGGTLIHLDDACVCELIESRFGIVPDAEKFLRAQHLGMSEVARLVAEGKGSTERLKREFYSTLLPEIGVSKDALDDVIECVLERARAEMLWRKAEPATALTLAELRRRGLALGVVSNSDGRIESAFEQAGLAGYFDFFIDSFLVGVEKPDPAIFGFAIERASVAPAEAAYVGDLYSVDVVGARNAGLLPILYDPLGLHADADCLSIRSIGELLSLFDGRGAQAQD
jgi:putative hydrolase of the HAD superfamily